MISPDDLCNKTLPVRDRIIPAPNALWFARAYGIGGYRYIEQGFRGPAVSPQPPYLVVRGPILLALDRLGFSVVRTRLPLLPPGAEVFRASETAVCGHCHTVYGGHLPVVGGYEGTPELTYYSFGNIVQSCDGRYLKL